MDEGDTEISITEKLAQTYILQALEYIRWCLGLNNCEEPECQIRSMSLFKEFGHFLRDTLDIGAFRPVNAPHTSYSTHQPQHSGNDSYAKYKYSCHKSLLNRARDAKCMLRVLRSTCKCGMGLSASLHSSQLCASTYNRAN